MLCWLKQIKVIGANADPGDRAPDSPFEGSDLPIKGSSSKCFGLAVRNRFFEAKLGGNPAKRVSEIRENPVKSLTSKMRSAGCWSP